MQAQAAREPGRAHVLVIGNEKGGSGKSTTAMHIIVSLLREAAAVATIDLDARQGTLRATSRTAPPTPSARASTCRCRAMPPCRPAATTGRREGALRGGARAGGHCGADFVVIDTPGSDTHLSRLAHTWADTLLTPLNDSFIDLDLLARVDPDTLKIVRPSIYAEAVWKQRQIRSMQGAPAGRLDRHAQPPVVARRAQQARHGARVIEALAKRIGFRVAAGLSERVIYKELFLNGLTLLDLKRGGGGPSLTMSHVAARQEVRDLVAALNLPPPDTAPPSAVPETPGATPDQQAAG